MILIKNKRCSIHNILKEYPDAKIFDVTSRGEFKRLSPFYPHGGIPVPFSGSVTSQSVEGIWQGLKVFKSEGVDISKFDNTSMKGLKRRGICLGHQKGLGSKELLGYIDARKKIYIPSYNWMLENKCGEDLKIIRHHLGETIIFLDYDTNDDVEDTSKPLSHASLIKKYLENNRAL